MDRIAVSLLEPTDRPHYRARWRRPGGRWKYRSLGTADPARAEQLRADWEYELNHGIAEQGAALSWADLRGSYEREALADRRPATRAKWRYAADRFEALSRPQSAAALDERAVSAHAARLRASGLSPATVGGHLAYLRACLRWAARQRLLARAPAVEMPRASPGRPRALPPDALPRLLAACPCAGWRLLVLTAWHTGLRRNELLALTWCGEGGAPRVDLAARRIDLPADHTKAGRHQWVPLRGELAGALAAAARPSGRVLQVPRSPNEVSRRFTRIANAAGLGVTLHDLRRGFASRYAPLVEAPVLRRLMRHADIRTTLAYYADVDGALHDAIESG